MQVSASPHAHLLEQTGFPWSSLCVGVPRRDCITLTKHPRGREGRNCLQRLELNPCLQSCPGARASHSAPPGSAGPEQHQLPKPCAQNTTSGSELALGSQNLQQGLSGPPQPSWEKEGRGKFRASTGHCGVDQQWHPHLSAHHTRDVHTLFSSPQGHFQSVHPSTSSFPCWSRAQSSVAGCCRPLQQLYLQSTNTSLAKKYKKKNNQKQNQKSPTKSPPNLSYSCNVHGGWGVRSNQMRAWVVSKIYATKSGIWATALLNSAVLK